MCSKFGIKCMKWLLFVFNILFFFFGGVLLGLGIWITVDSDNFLSGISTNSAVFDAVYIIIAVGAALMLISFFGCCGALRENKCMLGAFFALVLVIFAAEVVGSVLAFVFYPQTETTVIASFKEYQIKNGSEVRNAASYAWDALQRSFACCGFDSTDNWVKHTNGTFPTDDGAMVPESCCPLTESDNFSNLTACGLLQERYYYASPCQMKIQTYFWVIGGVGLGVLVIELLAMIFSCCVFCSINKEE